MNQVVFQLVGTMFNQFQTDEKKFFFLNDLKMFYYWISCDLPTGFRWKCYKHF